MKRPSRDKHAIPEGEAEANLNDYPLVEPARDKDLEPGVLYVIGPAKRLGPFKVGYCTSIASRSSSIQSCSSVDYLVFEEAEFAELRDAREAEKTVHEALKAYRVRGEWFKAPLDVICSAVMEQFASRKNVAKTLLRKLNEENCERHGVSKVEISRLREVACGAR